jgi:hypothetical protein
MLGPKITEIVLAEGWDPFSRLPFIKILEQFIWSIYSQRLFKLNMSINPPVLKWNFLKFFYFWVLLHYFRTQLQKCLLNICFSLTINEANTKQVLNKFGRLLYKVVLNLKAKNHFFLGSGLVYRALAWDQTIFFTEENRSKIKVDDQMSFFLNFSPGLKYWGVWLLLKL